MYEVTVIAEDADDGDLSYSFDFDGDGEWEFENVAFHRRHRYAAGDYQFIRIQDGWSEVTGLRAGTARGSVGAENRAPELVEFLNIGSRGQRRFRRRHATQRRCRSYLLL